MTRSCLVLEADILGIILNWNMRVKIPDSEAVFSEFESQLCHLQAVWPQVNCGTSIGLIGSLPHFCYRAVLKMK